MHICQEIDPQNVKVELQLATSEGQIITTFIINNRNTMEFDMDKLLASILFLLWLDLLAKYLLFYEINKPN